MYYVPDERNTLSVLLFTGKKGTGTALYSIKKDLMGSRDCV